MRHALRLARRGLGNTWPNPSVGAVIVKDNAVIGCGWTARGGKPHAETIALARAGEAAPGATLYVTLEPCSHHGKTPPCTESIIRSGIKRVVAACTDPNPLVSGTGFAQLRAAGIEVVEKICEAEANRVNEGFFSAIQRKRPFVTLKLATSLDGKITRPDGDSKWVTGEKSRQVSHLLRATHDAILTGIGTVLADDPLLTCRLPGCEAGSPQRVVLDSRLRIPAQASILPAWIFTSEEAAKENILKNAKVFPVPSFPLPPGEDFLSLTTILETLAAEGITRLLVEAGSQLAGSFVHENLVDRIYWFRSPVIIGEKGLNALHGQELTKAISRYGLREAQAMDTDTLEIYERRD